MHFAVGFSVELTPKCDDSDNTTLSGEQRYNTASPSITNTCITQQRANKLTNRLKLDNMPHIYQPFNGTATRVRSSQVNFICIALNHSYSLKGLHSPCLCVSPPQCARKNSLNTKGWTFEKQNRRGIFQGP